MLDKKLDFYAEDDDPISVAASIMGWLGVVVVSILLLSIVVFC